MKKVAIITGASSGMGKSTAKFLAAYGITVYGVARRLEQMNDLKELGIHTSYIDLTDDESIQKCVNTILEKEKRIDILINNAGYGSYGTIEDVPIEEAKRQFEVNIFGLARITQLILPIMRKQKSGRIVNISSMGGKVYTPMGAWYFATKHALEAWSDCLRLEVKEFGIDVVIVQPGGIKTDWGVIAVQNLRERSANGAYTKFANKVANTMEKLYGSKKLTKMDVLGKTIADVSVIKKPRKRYAKGFMAKTSIGVRRWLGDTIFEKILMMQFR